MAIDFTSLFGSAAKTISSGASLALTNKAAMTNSSSSLTNLLASLGSGLQQGAQLTQTYYLSQAQVNEAKAAAEAAKYGYTLPSQTTASIQSTDPMAQYLPFLLLGGIALLMLRKK